MSNDTDDIQKLLRLKRHERPPEDFFDDFLKEFQSRQRSELMTRSAHGLFFERLGTYFSGFGTPRIVGAAAGACAVAVVAILMFRGPVSDTTESDRSNFAGVSPLPDSGYAVSTRSVDFTLPIENMMFQEDLHPPTERQFVEATFPELLPSAATGIPPGRYEIVF